MLRIKRQIFSFMEFDLKGQGRSHMITVLNFVREKNVVKMFCDFKTKKIIFLYVLMNIFCPCFNVLRFGQFCLWRFMRRCTLVRQERRLCVMNAENGLQALLVLRNSILYYRINHKTFWRGIFVELNYFDRLTNPISCYCNIILLVIRNSFNHRINHKTFWRGIL